MDDPNIFKPGLRFNAIALQAVKSKFASNFAGYKHDQYIVIEHPIIDGVPMRLEEGTVWIIYFVHNGFIYEFTSQIIGATKSPFPLTFLSYPNSIDRTDLRIEKRYPVEVEAEFYLDPEEIGRENWLKGTIQDISLKGCQLKTKIPLLPGTIVHLALSLHDQGEIKNMTATAKNCRKAGDSYLVGLSFFDFTTPDYEKWSDYITRLIAVSLRV